MKRSSNSFYAPSLLKNGIADWYKTETNTAALLKAVVSTRPVKALSAEDLFSIARLTWITASKGRVSENHWRTQKVPALAQLFRTGPFTTADDLSEAISSMTLPGAVAKAAVRETGVVNFYNAYRNACRGWLHTNSKLVIEILEQATKLDRRDQERLALAARIETLPHLFKPSGFAPMSATSLITPIVAFLDPFSRFPIVNGSKSVNTMLRKSGLAKTDSLVNQVRALLGWIGQFGIKNAFMLDVLADEIPENIQALKLSTAVPLKRKILPTKLPLFDESERIAVLRSQTKLYRTLHNRMTNSIQSILQDTEVLQSTDPDRRFDALIKNYDLNGRDLLIEAKPEADRGSIRMAIGQLFDYLRRLEDRAATDLAILTITKPDQSYMDLLLDLQITPLWFKDEKCQKLMGEGIAWPLAISMARPSIRR